MQGNEMCAAALVRPRSPVDWIWQGYLARGATTLLTSQWKSGKTTLVSILLSKLADLARPLPSFDATTPAEQVRAIMSDRRYAVAGIRRHGMVCAFVETGDLCGDCCGDAAPTFDEAHIVPELAAGGACAAAQGDAAAVGFDAGRSRRPC
jgi:hypothetical protein